jgi:hypothetical protein
MMMNSGAAAAIATVARLAAQLSTIERQGVMEAVRDSRSEL